MDATVLLALLKGPAVTAVGLEPSSTIESARALHEKLRTLTRATDAVTDHTIYLRTLVMAGLATPAELAEYASMRDEARSDLAAFEAAIRARGTALADAVLALARTHRAPVVPLPVGGYLVGAIKARLAERGAGFLVVEAAHYARVVPRSDGWFLQMRTRLPAAPAPASLDELPDLAPWAAALPDYRRFFEAIGVALPPAPALLPVLPPEDPAVVLLERAADRLEALVARDPAIATSIGGPPRRTLRTLAIRGRLERAAFAAFDAWSGAIYVAKDFERLTPEQAASILAHELVHYSDAERLGELTGSPAAEVQVLVSMLPPMIEFGVRASMEDRAYRLQLRVMIALGVRGTLGAPEAKAALKSGGGSLSADFDATASLLHAARADRASWVDLAARETGLVPPAAEFVHGSR